MENLITVILPVYNGGDYLKLSIDSVLQQTLTDFEFIICDDCSTDNSFAVISSYTDKRIRYYRNEKNLKLFETLNKMIRSSTGNLIKLWSQDDIMLPECLATTKVFHEKYPGISFSYSDRIRIDENGKVVGENSLKNDDTPEYIPGKLHDKIAFYTGSIAGNISNVTMRKSCVEEVGYFDTSMTICADFDMWVKLTAKYDTGRIRIPLIYLRDHSGQFSRSSAYYLLHLKEDCRVFKQLKERSDAEMNKFGRYYLRWRKYPLYFNYMLKVASKGEWKEAKVFFSELSKLDNIFLLTFRWIIIKIFGKSVIKKPALQ